mmetsp:Transcript_26218/g.65650  ORF Transcript_26218/g.65650 Transcript_26218/m.65650 type:complete len:452 (+) Transcript_26218:498-1853(+)
MPPFNSRASFILTFARLAAARFLDASSLVFLSSFFSALSSLFSALSSWFRALLSASFSFAAGSMVAMVRLWNWPGGLAMVISPSFTAVTSLTPILTSPVLGATPTSSAAPGGPLTAQLEAAPILIDTTPFPDVPPPAAAMTPPLAEAPPLASVVVSGNVSTTPVASVPSITSPIVTPQAVTSSVSDVTPLSLVVTILTPVPVPAVTPSTAASATAVVTSLGIVSSLSRASGPTLLPPSTPSTKEESISALTLKTAVRPCTPSGRRGMSLILSCSICCSCSLSVAGCWAGGGACCGACCVACCGACCGASASGSTSASSSGSAAGALWLWLSLSASEKSLLPISWLSDADTLARLRSKGLAAAAKSAAMSPKASSLELGSGSRTRVMSVLPNADTTRVGQVLADFLGGRPIRAPFFVNRTAPPLAPCPPLPPACMAARLPYFTLRVTSLSSS